MWADRCHVATGPSNRHAYKPIRTCCQEGMSSWYVDEGFSTQNHPSQMSHHLLGFHDHLVEMHTLCCEPWRILQPLSGVLSWFVLKPVCVCLICLT